jgi:hypothetical protein
LSAPTPGRAWPELKVLAWAILQNMTHKTLQLCSGVDKDQPHAGGTGPCTNQIMSLYMGVCVVQVPFEAG